MKTAIRSALGLAALPLLLLAGQANAALIRITPTGVAVDEQVITDPVPISADGFRLSYWGGGEDELLDPVLLIIATPTGTTAPSLTPVGANPVTLSTTVTVGGANVYGGTWNTVTGAAGTFDASAGNDSVYEVIGLTPDGSDSQNYPNWSGAGDATSWNLFVYRLVFNPDFNHGDWVEFSTDLPVDSFVVGYGCTVLANGGGSTCRNAGATESTPFTFAGHVTTSVPEPSTIALLGVGLLLAGLGGKRRSKSRNA